LGRREEGKKKREERKQKRQGKKEKRRKNERCTVLLCFSQTLDSGWQNVKAQKGIA